MSLEKIIRNLTVAVGITAGVLGFNDKAKAQQCQQGEFQYDNNTIALSHFNEGHGSNIHIISKFFNGGFNTYQIYIQQIPGDPDSTSWVPGVFSYGLKFGNNYIPFGLADSTTND